MPDIAYVEGEFVPLAEARVPVSDRAFYYADAVYEVCATYGGRIFLLDEHLDRLERSLRGIRIGDPLDRRRLAGLLEEGIRRAGYAETLIYIQIGRGVAARSKRFPLEPCATLVLTFRQKPVPDPRQRERGIEAILVADPRWAHCEYKTVMLLPNVLAHQEALDRGKDEAIFYDREANLVREATGANVFIVRGDGLATPEEGARILAGTIRRYLINLARRNGIRAEERPVTVEELLGADEVFLTGTTTEVLGVVRVDDRTVGTGTPGPMTRRLHRLFEQSVGIGAREPDGPAAK